MANPEKAFISAVLRTRDYAKALEQELSPEMFASHPAEWSWLTDHLSRHRRVPSRVAFIHAFPDFSVLRTDDVAHFADEVRKSFARREMQRSMLTAAESLNTGDLDMAMQTMQSAIIATAQSMGTVADGNVLKESAKKVLTTVTEYHDRIVDTGSPGFPTGFDTWDDVTGGVKPGEVVIVAGRTGVGKSWLLTEIAANSLMAGHTVLYDSLEMSVPHVALRAQTILATKTGRPFAAASLLSSRTPPDLVGFREAQAWLSRQVPGNLHIADTKKGPIGTMTIGAQIERIRPQLVIVDYMTLLKKNGDSDWQSIADLSGQLQGLAQRYEVGMVVAAQLNREAANASRGRSMPGLETLSRSDAIGMDADQVVVAAARSKRVLQMKLAKNRSGAGGMTWWVQFEPAKGVIKEIDGNLGQQMVDEDFDADGPNA